MPFIAECTAETKRNENTRRSLLHQQRRRPQVKPEDRPQHRLHGRRADYNRQNHLNLEELWNPTLKGRRLPPPAPPTSTEHLNQVNERRRLPDRSAIAQIPATRPDEARRSHSAADTGLPDALRKRCELDASTATHVCRDRC